ncbi:MAG: hypothetical protein JNN04_17280 [Cyclobacteriaceae bacterium]|nr:hypothetical protein [Cyclobacteriaceae bacterium]
MSFRCYPQLQRVLVTLLLSTVLFGSCAPRREKPQPIEVPKEKTDTLRTEINKMFPGAVPFNEYTDSLLFFLYAVHRIKPEMILLGQSTCVDDVMNTKSPFNGRMIKGPFNFGGLGGLPFTGLTGLSAYAHHVPDSGTALLLVGPHIGYSMEGGWGMLKREGQAHSSTCCGALVAALTKLQKNSIYRQAPSEPDYQEQTLEQLALRHKGQILKSEVPLVTFTKIVNRQVEKAMSSLPEEEARFRYVITIIAVIINTDVGYPDYIWVERMSIYDLETEEYLRNMEK